MRRRVLLRAYVWLAALAGLLLGACATADPGARPFSEGWHDQIKSERAHEQRMQRLRGKKAVLAGQEGASRAAVVMDEKGRPRLNVGKEDGLSADVNYSHGPEGRLKYKVDWDFAKPMRKE